MFQNDSQKKMHKNKLHPKLCIYRHWITWRVHLLRIISIQLTNKAGLQAMNKRNWFGLYSPRTKRPHVQRLSVRLTVRVSDLKISYCSVGWCQHTLCILSVKLALVP